MNKWTMSYIIFHFNQLAYQPSQAGERKTFEQLRRSLGCQNTVSENHHDNDLKNHPQHCGSTHTSTQTQYSPTYL